MTMRELRDLPPYSKQHDIVEDLGSRGDIETALTAGSLLDGALYHLLRTRFTELRKPVNDGLFGPEGIFANASAKLKASEGLGLVTSLMANDIAAIFIIRNAFGHSLKDVTFDHESIADKISALNYPRIMTSELSGMVEIFSRHDAVFQPFERDGGLWITDSNGAATLALDGLDIEDGDTLKIKFAKASKAIWGTIMVRLFFEPGYLAKI